MDAETSFGGWLQKRRKALDLTQAALGQRVGLSRSAIRKLEAGERRPSPQTAELLAAALHIPAEDRALFLRVARGERPMTRLGAPPDLAARAARAALPTPPTAVIGREAERAELRRLLAPGEPGRLITLVGPGGIGKTRLALQAAIEAQGAFAGGAFWVALAPVRDPAHVAAAIAQAVGVRGRDDQSPAEALGVALRERQALLVLDNCEHVLAAAPLVAELLAGAPGLMILATSREVLRLSGERAFPVPPLAWPAPGQPTALNGLLGYDAVRLFVERAQAASPDFTLSAANAAAIAETCARLEGLPLAIELAAARLRHLTAPALLARLERRLPLLTGGARDLPARQRTLRDAIAWSHDLLTGPERVLFRRMAVFLGGGALEAVEAVCQPGLDLPVLDGLSSLVDKSLLSPAAGAVEPRYSMLETIREFALEQLEASGEAPELRRRHRDYYLALAEQAKPWRRQREVVAWLDRFERDHDNLRAALRWTLAQGEAETAVNLFGRVWWFWELRGYVAEARLWLEQVLAITGGGRVSPHLRAWALQDALRSASAHGDVERMSAVMTELLALRPLLDGADDYWITFVSQGALARDQGDHERARALFEERLVLARRTGEKLAWSAHDLAEVAQLQGDAARARELYRESQQLFRERGETIGLAWSLHNEAYLTLAGGQAPEAAAQWREALRLFQELGARDGLASCLVGLAALAARRGQFERAARLQGAMEAERQASGIGLGPVARAAIGPLSEALRVELGEAAFEAAQAEGRALTLPAAITYAVAEA